MMQASAPEIETSMLARDEAHVFVVDDDISVREALEGLIGHEQFHVMTFVCADDFLRHPPPDAPACLVLDVSLPGLNGLELQKFIVAERPGTPIIFITGSIDVPTTVKAMKAGAVEFLTKPFTDHALLSAIDDAIKYSVAYRKREEETRTVEVRYLSLTRRERVVLDLVMTGLPNKLIADRLSISEVTVKAHRGSVMRKMQADSLAGLIHQASRLRLTKRD